MKRNLLVVSLTLAVALCYSQATIGPLLTGSNSAVAINYSPSGWPSETVEAGVLASAEVPGSRPTVSLSGTANCQLNVFWPGSSLTGAPPSVTVEWYTTDEIQYEYYLRGSGSYPVSGSVSGAARVTESSGIALPYSELYNQMSTTQYGASLIVQDGESESNITYATSFQWNSEDGYYVSQISVDNVGLSASGGYTAPTHGDTKDNEFATAALVYFTLP